VDEDDTERFSYCGCDVLDGQLRVLFRQGRLGTNTYDAVSTDNLLKALNDAPPSASSNSDISFRLRTGIRQDWDPEIGKTLKKAADMLEKPDFRFEPNWSENFKALKEAAAKKGSSLREDWESRMAYVVRLYFEGFVGQLDYQKFGEDEMLREGFNEGIEKGLVVFRVLGKMKYETYCECDIEDGVLYLQVSVLWVVGILRIKANIERLLRNTSVRMSTLRLRS